MKKIVALILLILSTGCSKKSKLNEYSNINVSAGFDTYLSLKISAEKLEDFENYFNESVNLYDSLNRQFDIYNSYPGINNLKTINEFAGIEPVKVDQEIIDLLLLSKEMSELSNGAFDVSAGALFKKWHDYREADDGSIPSDEELQNTLKCIGWEFVEINDTNNTVYINNPCASLDVGAIAKGYATEKIAHLLEEKEVVMAIIDAGGNNRTINNKEDGSPWNVGIQNPDDSGSIAIVSKRDSSSFVTSGDYQRYYMGDDQIRYHHIIDPKTAYPANYFRSVTVITTDSGIADAFSTILFSLPYKEGLAIIEKYNTLNPENLISAVWILDKENSQQSDFTLENENFQVIYTEDLKDSIKLSK
ncbi:MAG: FAD:protein FMN transferase [Anaerorhabdus sp.]